MFNLSRWFFDNYLYISITLAKELWYVDTELKSEKSRQFQLFFIGWYELEYVDYRFLSITIVWLNFQVGICQ